MSEFTDFLGVGWSFPPKFNRDSAQVEMRSNEEDIDESLQILLSTIPGERIMRPDYGCNLEELLFNPINLSLTTYISDLIRTAILYHEPRIDVEKIDFSESDPLEGEVRIQIDYKVRATNSRKNLVFPFYKGEGSLK
jgi:uncharacterized protein